MTDRPDPYRDLEPPTGARCARCGGTERLGPIVSVYVGPSGAESSVAGWMCAACARVEALRRMEDEVASCTKYVETFRDHPLHRWNVERSARHCAAGHRRTLARLREAPSPAVAEFIARHDPDGRGEAELAALSARGAQRPPCAEISEPEMLAAYRLMASDEDDARELGEDELRRREQRPNDGNEDPLLLLAVATLSPEAESRMRAYLRTHHEWTDERFDETLAWARREAFQRRGG